MRLFCIFVLFTFLRPAESTLTADDFQNIVRDVLTTAFKPVVISLNLGSAEGSTGEVAGHPGSLEGELKSTSFLQFKSNRFFRFMHAANIPLTKVMEMTEDDIRKILGEELSKQLLPLMNALSITAEGEPKPVDFEGQLEVLQVPTPPPSAAAPAIALAAVGQQQNPEPVAQFRQSRVKLHENRKSHRHH